MRNWLKNTWRKLIQRISAQDASHPHDHVTALPAASTEKPSVQDELQRIQDEIDGVRSWDAATLAALNERIVAMDAATQADRREIAELRQSLADAANRQEMAETQIRSLRERQEKERREHQAYVQESLAREHRQNRRLGWSLLLASCALLLGTLAGMTTYRDGRQYASLLTELSRDIKEIKASLEQQLGRMQESLEEHRLSLADQYTGGASPDSRQAWAVQPGGQQKESAGDSPTFVFKPHNNFRTRSEMRAFFEENARESGVISLDSGLQYRVLSHGNGRSPDTTDSVVFDYVSFLADGTEVYNSYREDEPAAHSIKEMIPGLQEALMHMHEGARWELYIPPGLAHKGVRKRGRGERAFEPVIYVVELRSVMEGGRTMEN
jgi:FKBP-type peptidyl-prolyl cis-trans isomerase